MDVMSKLIANSKVPLTTTLSIHPLIEPRFVAQDNIGNTWPFFWFVFCDPSALPCVCERETGLSNSSVKQECLIDSVR